MGDKNREIAEYYKKRRRGERDDEMLDRIVGGGRRQRKAKAEEREAKREYRKKRTLLQNAYTVQPGDSWFSIAGSEMGDQRYAGDLARANPGFDVLKPGTVIMLPPAGGEETAVLTYEDYEMLEGIQEKVEEAQAQAKEPPVTANSTVDGGPAGIEAEHDMIQAYLDRQEADETPGVEGNNGLEEEFNVADYEAEAQAIAQMLLEMQAEREQEEAETKGALKVAAPAQDVVLQENDPDRELADFPLVGLTGDVSPEIRKDWKTIEETFKEEVDSGEEGLPEDEENTPIEWYSPLPPDGEYADDTYTVYDQYHSSISGNDGYGWNACGLVAASSAVNDLGYPNSDLNFCVGEIFEASEGNYDKDIGIQPFAYYEAVKAVVEGGQLGEKGNVEQFNINNADDGLQIINEALREGNAVIVDITAISSTDAGTFPYPPGADKQEILGEERTLSPQGSFAHFLRVLGFEDGGNTIVLAEMLSPASNNPVVKVSVETFVQAWHNPENNAEYGIEAPDTLDYWFITISPPKP